MKRTWTVGIVVILLVLLAGMYLLGANRTKITQILPTPTAIKLIPSITSSTTEVSGTPSAMITPSQTVTQHEVLLTSTGFSPATITIKKGDTVVWLNQSGAPATVNSDPHPTHTDYPPLNLGSFGNGATLSLSFPKTGTYGYHNHLNPSQKGTVIVQ